MHSKMTELSEAARHVFDKMSADWRRQALQGKAHPPSQQAATLRKRMVKNGWCEAELYAQRTLLELYRAGILSVKGEGGEAMLDPRLGLNPRVGLAERYVQQVLETLPNVDAGLALNEIQARHWRQALDGCLAGWSREDQQRLVDGLKTLARALPAAYTLTSYTVSSRYLLESSKLLSVLPNELLRAFGIEPSRFAQSDSRVLAHVPIEPQGVLLIENAQSFTAACRVGLDMHFALVCEFGYGLALSQALSDAQHISLVGKMPSPMVLADLLELPNITYWGDLDPEGLRIYLRMKTHLPAMRLSALYGPMMERLEGRGGHPLSQATGKAGQRQGQGWTRGIDQEWVSDCDIERLAGETLEFDQEQQWIARIVGAEETN